MDSDLDYETIFIYIALGLCVLVGGYLLLFSGSPDTGAAPEAGTTDTPTVAPSPYTGDNDSNNSEFDIQPEEVESILETVNDPIITTQNSTDATQNETNNRSNLNQILNWRRNVAKNSGGSGGSSGSSSSHSSSGGSSSSGSSSDESSDSSGSSDTASNNTSTGGSNNTDNSSSTNNTGTNTSTGGSNNTDNSSSNNNTDNSGSNNTSVPVNPAYDIYARIMDVAGKGASGDITTAGSIVTYQISVENKGNVNLTGVVLNSPSLRVGTLVETISQNNILDIGETWRYAATYTVTQDDINAASSGKNAISSSATVDCDQLDQKSVSVNTPITLTSAYEISETYSGNISKAGDTVIFYTNVRNTGNMDLTNVVVSGSISDIVPTFNSPSGDIAFPGILNPGEVWNYSTTYVVTPKDINNRGGGDNAIDSTVNVKCGQLAQKSASASIPMAINPAIEVTAPEPSESITKEKDSVTFRVAVKNTGNIDFTNVEVSGRIESAIVGASESTFKLNQQDGDTTNGFNPGEVWNYATSYAVSKSDLDGRANDDSINVIFTVKCDGLSQTVSTRAKVITHPSYTITETADGDFSKAGDRITLNAVVTNTGDAKLTNVVISGSLQNTAFNLQSGDNTDVNVLNRGEKWTYGATYTVTQDDINNGTIHSIVGVDCDQLDQKTASADISVTKTSIISTAKTATDNTSAETSILTEPASTSTATTPGAETTVTYVKSGNTWYVGADDHRIKLINNNNAVNPTYDQMISFIRADQTDKIQYRKGSFVCADFAEKVHNNAEAAGYACKWVAIDFSDDNDGHACNAFDTTDRGRIYVDCTGSPSSDGTASWDATVTLEVGKPYIPIGIDDKLSYSSLGTVSRFEVF